MSPARLVFILLAIAAALTAAAIPIVLAVLRRRTGFFFGPSGKSVVVASDVGTQSSVFVRESRLGICGKPDYLLDTDTGGRQLLVPLEVKPTRRSRRLYDSDRVQIAAYLMALRSTFPDRASQVGYVRYADQTFDVALTPTLEGEIEQLTAAVRRGRRALVLHRSHNVAARCRRCPVRQHCDESLSG